MSEGLFLIDSDIESEYGATSEDETTEETQLEPPSKRPRVEKAVFDEFSESDVSEWEDVLPPPEYLISIQNGDLEKQKKHRQRVRAKRVRSSIHSLSMMSYLLHLRHRNRWLNDKMVRKRLRNLLPEKLLKQNKTLWKTSKKGLTAETDELLVYILKYVLKWFRKNYRLDSNGLRVLGYSGAKKNACFPNNASKIDSPRALASVCRTLKHNRDTGAQILTAVFRAMGFEARVVFSVPLLLLLGAPEQPDLHPNHVKNGDSDLLYPYFWTEVVNPLDDSDIFVVDALCSHEEKKQFQRLKRYTRRAVKKSTIGHYYTGIFSPVSDQLNVMVPMQYVVSIDSGGLMMDASPRYMANISYRYFHKLDLRTDAGRSAMLFQSLLRIFNTRKTYSDADNAELGTLSLVALQNYDIPTTFSAMKRNANLVTPGTLRYNEALDYANTESIGSVSLLDKRSGKQKSAPLYFKHAVFLGRSQQQWKFLGRSVRPEEEALPIKTTSALQPRSMLRKRQMGTNLLGITQKTQTPLYGFHQTCPYIKKTVFLDENGRKALPRNEYGNIEVFGPNMVPDGCVWVDLSSIEVILMNHNRGSFRSVSVAEKIEYVPVVVGFSFRTKIGRAIPVKRGVMVLKEQEVAAKKAWLYGKLTMDRKAGELQALRALQGWNSVLRRLRVRRALAERYGGVETEGRD